MRSELENIRERAWEIHRREYEYYKGQLDKKDEAPKDSFSALDELVTRARSGWLVTAMDSKMKRIGALLESNDVELPLALARDLQEGMANANAILDRNSFPGGSEMDKALGGVLGELWHREFIETQSQLAQVMVNHQEKLMAEAKP